MTREAFAFARDFEAAPPSELCVDRHYLLCASQGALRLEAHGESWVLPPARAALIAAGEPIQVAIPQPVTTSSVLFDPGFAPEPPAPLTVFDLSPLARALVSECVDWPDAAEPLPSYARSVFGALAAVAWRLAQHPSPVTVPAGQSPELRRALAITRRTAGRGCPVRGRRPRCRAGAALAGPPVRGRVRHDLARGAAPDAGAARHRGTRRGRRSVTTIAHTVGYTSLSAFNAGFRDLTGRTPTQYRATFRP